MRFGSLFAGIGGMDLGLERAGMECAWQVEIDDYCQRVLTKHWPDVPKFGDIRDCGKDNLEPVDLICGGFPCQDISYAGKGAGIAEGTRSGLWSEYHRIICELRPRYVLVENMAALLVRGIDRVLGDLAAGGYDAEWDCIPASAVGAPHRRDRVFVIAYPNKQGESQPGRGVSDFRGRSGHSNQKKTVPVADAQCRRLQGRIFGCAEPPAVEFAENCRTSLGTHVGQTWQAEPREDWLDDGVPGGMAEVFSRLTGNAVVPQGAEYIGRLIVDRFWG